MTDKPEHDALYKARMQGKKRVIDAQITHADQDRGERVYRRKRLYASYLYLYFPSQTQAAARLFLP